MAGAVLISHFFSLCWLQNKYTRVLLQLKIMTIACIGFKIKLTASLLLLYADGYSLQLRIPAVLHIPHPIGRNPCGRFCHCMEVGHSYLPVLAPQ